MKRSKFRRVERQFPSNRVVWNWYDLTNDTPSRIISFIRMSFFSEPKVRGNIVSEAGLHPSGLAPSAPREAITKKSSVQAPIGARSIRRIRRVKKRKNPNFIHHFHRSFSATIVFPVPSFFSCALPLRIVNRRLSLFFFFSSDLPLRIVNRRLSLFFFFSCALPPRIVNHRLCFSLRSLFSSPCQFSTR